VTKVLIADDHAILRRGLREILARDMQDVSCGEAKDSEEILEQVQSHSWDLLILDLGLPGGSGVDVLSDVRRLDEKLRILVLTMYPEDQYGRRVQKAGARGYLNKESAPEELITAIRRLLAGGRYGSAALAEKLAEDLQDHTETALETLSDRELEIL
jgi:two-component system invasion response regulator UvrY